MPYYTSNSAGMNAGIEKGYRFNSFTAGVGASLGGKVDIEAGYVIPF